MLKNYLISPPYSKFLVIEDSIEERGKPLFDFLLQHHLNNLEKSVHYFVFQENFTKVKKMLKSNTNIVLHDCITNPFQWSGDNKTETLLQILNKLGGRDVVFIDSLAHVIYQYGLSEAYKIFNTAKTQTCILQIICLLHLDLLEKALKVDEVFKHLCTFCLSMQPKFNNNNRRIKYLYKKSGAKSVNETEEYYFENNNFFSQKVEKIDIKKLLDNTNNDVNPETLSTFRIGLSDEEKKSRDQLVLPYLPKSGNQSSAEGGNIFYEFDVQDDWDEEDPDDDLDI